MWTIDLARSTPFRIAIAFSIAIAALTGAVFAVVYVEIVKADIARYEGVLSDAAAKAAGASDDELRETLALRLTHDFRRLDYVAVYGPDGALVFGNLTVRPDIPADGKAHYAPHFAGAPGEDDPALFVARTRPAGGALILGRSLQDAFALRRTVARALVVAVAPTALLALALGAFFARRISGHIAEIDRAIARIMAGDLRERLPVVAGNGDISNVARSVNAMLDEIERLLGQLASVGDNIAHDLRTPIVNVRAVLEQALAAAPKDDPLRRPVQAALRQLDRAMTTIAALLRISSIENERRHAAFRQIDLAALCAELHEFFLPLAKAKGVEMTLVAAAPVSRLGDPDLMREAIANLIDNALKFTPRGGAIRIIADEPGGLARIRVSDTGRGVPAVETHDIFRRFARAKSSADLPGAGLGLSIAETIARLHRMGLSVSDNAPGALFTLAEHAPENAPDLAAGKVC